MADNSDSISLGGAEDAAKVEVGIDEEEEIVSASMRRTQLASMSEVNDKLKYIHSKHETFTQNWFKVGPAS